MPNAAGRWLWLTIYSYVLLDSWGATASSNSPSKMVMPVLHTGQLLLNKKTMSACLSQFRRTHCQGADLLDMQVLRPRRLRKQIPWIVDDGPKQYTWHHPMCTPAHWTADIVSRPPHQVSSAPHVLVGGNPKKKLCRGAQGLVFKRARVPLTSRGCGTSTP